MTDRIVVSIDTATDAVHAAVAAHEAYVAEQVLATAIALDASPSSAAHRATVDDAPFCFTITLD